MRHRLSILFKIKLEIMHAMGIWKKVQFMDDYFHHIQKQAHFLVTLVKTNQNHKTTMHEKLTWLTSNLSKLLWILVIKKKAKDGNESELNSHHDMNEQIGTKIPVSLKWLTGLLKFCFGWIILVREEKIEEKNAIENRWRNGRSWRWRCRYHSPSWEN